jgi:alcohol dehydrogenase (cytochrome c)
LIAPALIALLLAQTAAPAADPERITPERLVRARSEPHNWLTYSGSYDGHRHSSLAQINAGNVARLQPAWIYQAREFGKAETSPIVLDGVLYITERSQAVTALDGRTGRPLWSFARPRSTRVPTCCGDVNRGLAALDDALYLATLDAHLIALDRRSGKKRWDVTVADWTTGHSLTLAPLAVKDKIIIGISGGEFGVRGFIDAYDARTGKRLWRFWTVPGPGEPGHDSWSGDSWKTGGAPEQPKSESLRCAPGPEGRATQEAARVRGDSAYRELLTSCTHHACTCGRLCFCRPTYSTPTSMRFAPDHREMRT